MSATFKIAAKKKYTQNDLRKLMQEQKSKQKAAGQQAAPVEKIDSPLAKYNEAGQLTCILCKSVVRAVSVWKVHVNTKNHKENVAAAKALKDKLQSSAVCAQKTQKRTQQLEKHEVEVPHKKLKGILKNSSTETTKLTQSNGGSTFTPNDPIPMDFFDSKTGFFEATLNKTSIQKDLVNIKRTDADVEKMEVDELKEDEKLPEGFFDDPIKDAKIHNKEYKNPQEEEWERFQKEIKEEAIVSNEIIAGEQDDSTAKRQIEEIDEQIRQWSKVLNLERKKEVVYKKVNQKLKKLEDSEDDDSDAGENFDEFLDWRAKRLN